MGQELLKPCWCHFLSLPDPAPGLTALIHGVTVDIALGGWLSLTGDKLELLWEMIMFFHGVRGCDCSHITPSSSLPFSHSPRHFQKKQQDESRCWQLSRLLFLSQAKVTLVFHAALADCSDWVHEWIWIYGEFTQRAGSCRVIFIYVYIYKNILKILFQINIPGLFFIKPRIYTSKKKN